jgi:hypothetical protein
LPEIRSTIPSGASYILVDELQTRLRSDSERRTVPFLEKDGEYWGRPADDQQAISEIERLRKSGCTHIVVAWPAMWWLNYYDGFNRYLRSNFYCTLNNERLVAFDLRRQLDSPRVAKIR